MKKHTIANIITCGLGTLVGTALAYYVNDGHLNLGGILMGCGVNLLLFAYFQHRDQELP